MVTTNPDLKGESDLTTTILELIRAENRELKISTEMQIRHEIALKLDLAEAKMRRYKETISALCKRLDKFESPIPSATSGEMKSSFPLTTTPNPIVV